MTGSRRWRRVQQVFHGALRRRGPERDAFLETACRGDGTLRAEVEALLDEDARDGSPLDRGVGPLAEAVLRPPEAHDIPSNAFGPYRATRRLGEGGMGVVYLAVRDDLGSIAALKVLKDAWLSPARRERFAAEQRTLAQLSHPSIARLYDADSLPDGTPWFVMEYVDGVPITDYCAQRATSIEGRLELFRRVLGAVEHAHGQAVIHRDLKPSNILVSADGTVKLLDFGIAKHLEALDEPIEQTRTGLRMMTPAYAAPEQVRGERVGVQADVYSLGVLLYELLTGTLPIDLSDASPIEAAARVAEIVPERPSVIARRLAASGKRPARARHAGRIAWRDLDVLCLKALRKDPARRYPTVEAFQRDVRRCLDGDPLEARPETLRYRVGRLVRRHRAELLSAAAVVALIVALVLVYALRLAEARDTARAEAARAERSHAFLLRLFEGGDRHAGPSDDLRVVTLLDRGVQEAHAIHGDPRAQGELYRALGGIYRKLGRFDDAEPLLAGAVERLRALGEATGRKDADLGAALVDLALLHLDRARLDEAESAVREGLLIAGTAGGARHADLARATAVLGQVHEARGRYDDAAAAAEDAVALYSRERTTTPELAGALGQLADARYYAGRYDEADAINARVLELVRTLHGARHPRVADVLMNLGASQADRGRYADAENLYDEALSILTEFYGANHHRTASASTMLGRVLVYQARFDEGVPLLESSLAIQERVHGSVHPSVASAVNDLGSAALQQGRLAEAGAAFARMETIYREIHGDGHALLGIALSNRASVLVARGEFAPAESLYREAIAIWERAQAPDHLNVGIGRVKLGRTLLRQGRYADARGETSVGYAILAAQAEPSVSWLQSARTDLAEIHRALGDEEAAARFVTERDAAGR